MSTKLADLDVQALRGALGQKVRALGTGVWPAVLDRPRTIASDHDCLALAREQGVSHLCVIRWRTDRTAQAAGGGTDRWDLVKSFDLIFAAPYDDNVPAEYVLEEAVFRTELLFLANDALDVEGFTVETKALQPVKPFTNLLSQKFELLGHAITFSTDVSVKGCVP